MELVVDNGTRVSSRVRSAKQVAEDGVRPSDEVLLERVAAGDREAFADLYDRASRAVHGLALRVLRDRALAEEVTQDVFLNVWLKASSFDRSRGRASTWLLTITHRRAVDVVRREQALRDRTERSAMVAEQPAFDVVSEDIHARSTALTTSEQVAHALRSLTELQRNAIVMAYFGGLTYAQVAERLSVPLPTVKSRIRDGLRSLAAELATPLALGSARSA